jgi:transposase
LFTVLGTGQLMSLQVDSLGPVPAQTAAVARAAFPNGNPYLILREALGPLYRDEDFSSLFPSQGQPALSPWQLAVITVLQFRENLPDRQAAEAVRARIDWKYLLGLELADPGFDFSVLCEFRARLIEGAAEWRLLDKLLERCRQYGLLKARGRQRTDSTHVLASVRTLGRLELVGETLRAALNEIATVAPDWLYGVAPVAWYDHYGRRIEDSRLPRSAPERQSYGQQVGEDGQHLLELVEAPNAPAELRQLPKVAILRLAWARHYAPVESPHGGPARVRFKTDREVTQAAEQLESPYDPEARYRSKHGLHWTGYMVHVSETCEADSAHLITHVHTTPADVHEARCTDAIHQALADKGLAPREHLVDAAYVSAEILVHSQTQFGIDLVGPARGNPTWQTKVEGAYSTDQFQVDWEHRIVYCPQKVASVAWRDAVHSDGKPYHRATFPREVCQACPARSLCTQAQQGPRRVYLHPRPEHEALQATRHRLNSPAGRELYAQRAGIEGTLSQGVRAFGLRRTRYRGLAKTHLQQVGTAAAINLDRLVAHLTDQPRETTRTSRFAALAA